MDAAGMLLGSVPLVGQLGFQRRRTTAVTAKLLLGLLEEFLISFEHPSLLAMRLEQLGHILAEAVLNRVCLLELHLKRSSVGCEVGRAPGRTGRPWICRLRGLRRWGVRRRRLRRRFLRGLLPPGEG